MMNAAKSCRVLPATRRTFCGVIAPASAGGVSGRFDSVVRPHSIDVVMTTTTKSCVSFSICEGLEVAPRPAGTDGDAGWGAGS